jgi:hypothetical protein
MRKGASRTIELGLPVQADVGSTGVVSLSGETLEEATGERSLTIQSVDSGETTISLSLFGLPVKTVKVNVSDDVMVIPGGQSIGVTLYTKGALVVGITGIQLANGEIVIPARTAGMLPGDVILSINGTEVKTYSSQGQQRTAALSLKLSELDIIKSEVGEYPVLLLDDVLSELDISRQKFLIEALKNVQTMLTCTSLNDIKNFHYEERDIFKVREGRIEKKE